MNVRIPDTIEEMKERLGTLGRLLTAQGWERAAIVYAFTYEPGQGSRSDLANNSQVAMTCNAFADLKIHGLTQHNTVCRHRRNWQAAIDDGLAVAAKPGDDVVLPTIEYERVKQNVFTDGLTSPETPPEKKADIVREVMRRDPDVERLVENDFVRKAATDPVLAARVAMAGSERLVAPMEPRFPATAQTALGFGSQIAYFVGLPANQSHCEELVEYVNRQERDGDAEIAAIAQGEIDALDRAKAIIDGYQDAIREALGRGVDATFSRLMGRG